MIDIDMLLMVGNAIRGGICHAIYPYAEANSTYMRDFDSNKELLYFMYLDVNNLYGWAISWNLPVGGFD